MCSSIKYTFEFWPLGLILAFWLIYELWPNYFCPNCFSGNLLRCFLWRLSIKVNLSMWKTKLEKLFSLLLIWLFLFGYLFSIQKKNNFVLYSFSSFKFIISDICSKKIWIFFLFLEKEIQLWKKNPTKNVCFFSHTDLFSFLK